MIIAVPTGIKVWATVRVPVKLTPKAYSLGKQTENHQTYRIIERGPGPKPVWKGGMKGR